MLTVSRLVLLALGLAPQAFGQNLLVSHYTGKVFSLSLAASGTSGTLKVGTSASGCGKMPSWLTLDSASGTLYCFDEEGNSGVVSQYKVGSDGSVTMTGQAKTTGGDVHGWLFGGSDGKGFLAMAE
jgi:6-phosphogluconolactonase (cycloisomerase 2 family)